jgi:hypothetical protein
MQGGGLAIVESVQVIDGERHVVARVVPEDPRKPEPTTVRPDPHEEETETE